jgi:nucleoside-diphosphate-sugar epimerase
MYSSSAKAEDELGYRASSVDDAVGRAVRWYRENGYAA